MRLILVRHPKPDCAPGLCYGHLDLACDAQDLARAARDLASLAHDATIISSPLRRALALARALSPQVRTDDRLRELNFGAWEGRPWGEIGRAAIDGWRSGLPNAAPPGGESLVDLAARCADWLAAIRPKNETVIAVTHAGPIRIMRALALGQPLLRYFDTPIPYGTALELTFGTQEPFIARPEHEISIAHNAKRPHTLHASPREDVSEVAANEEESRSQERSAETGAKAC